MEARPLSSRIRRRGASRALYAAALLGALLAALLGAWFFSGWHDVRMRQHEARDLPHRQAVERADDIARELRGELDGLLGREMQRPYFHYQNLMHDPKASIGDSVAPSPLARNPDDQLVLGYFQIDSQGRATTPTINDDFPDLSEPERLAANRSFRDQIVRDLVGDLQPSAPPVVVAAASPPPPRPRPVAPPHPHLTPTREATPPVAQQADPAPQAQAQAQVIQLDPNVYAQNSNSNAVYSRHLDNNRPLTQAGSAIGGGARASGAKNGAAMDGRRIQSAQPVVRTPSPARAEPPAPVTITISPLEWRTLRFAGAPVLVAVRQVQTPDGNFAQGFVIDRSSLTSTLAARAGDMVAELHAEAADKPVPDSATSGSVAAPDSSVAAAERAAHGVAIAPGWQLTVAPNPRTLAQAAASAIAVARTFLIRFFAIGAVALVAAGFVLLLVLRAEALARERSQFAAAAAHELRTPLAGLQLYGDMLADGLGDPTKIRDYARRMSEEASRLGRVVSNVLGFSQLERGNLAVDPQIGALGDALRELAERAEPALDRAGAVLELDVPAELHAKFDRDALARIVGNLLDNAEKYARGADDRTIRLAAEDRGDVIEIVVADHGPGVADRTQLFRVFSRGVSADGPAGLGLGLALSQSLAEAMGGELAYRPGAGAGATFVLTLRRA